MNLNREIAPMMVEELRRYIDIVEVVRCKNCEWWCKDPDGITYCELNSTRCNGNHFCSLGVQKVMEETDD